MIKLTNILNEMSEVNDDLKIDLLDTTVNRKILSLILKSHPELPIKLKDYIRHSDTKQYRKDYVYRKIEDFINTKLGIRDSEVVIGVALFYLINPLVGDPKTEEMYGAKDIYHSFIQFTGDEIDEFTETDTEECDECIGYGYEDCGYCDTDGEEVCGECGGDGFVEDEDGEEGDTLDCGTCNGSGVVECDECGGAAEVDCRECDGNGTVDVEYTRYDLPINTMRFISFQKLDYQNLDEYKYTPISDFHSKNEEKKYFLWVNDIEFESARDNTDDLVYDKNELIETQQNKISLYDIKYML
ncbi:MAG: zinc finger-like domain-containing protein [Proteobacteria bacterium]|nr:zinc finger-like domain-containing protein [Pseudomonadota bacterium]